MKKEIKIFVLGGTRAVRVFVSLSNRYKHVSYFNSKEECLNAMHKAPDILIVDESLKESDPMGFIGAIKNMSKTHILYLSKDRHFYNIIKAFKSGASDYIIKDSYLHFSVNKTVDRFLKRTDDLSTQISIYDCRNESSLKFIYPFRFKLLQWFTRQ